MDIVFVGGGLANCLLAARIFERRLRTRILLLEAGESVGGNHTWSVHASDLSHNQHVFLSPFRANGWKGNDVHFPAYSRLLKGHYHSLSSDRLAQVMNERMCASIRTGARVVEVAANHVVLEGGERIEAGAVVDGRGALASRHLDLGYQKFLGQEVRLTAPHGLLRPVIMDARVEQVDGYRFVYVLPLDPETLLVEDTYYADGPDLPVETLRRRIAAYVAAQGWTMDYVVREEQGVLPIALGGDIEAFLGEGPPGVARSGLRAGLFHPTTGYSVPDAVDLADKVSVLPELTGAAISAFTRAHAVSTWKRRGFFRLLNRMLFRAAAPAQRYAILQRFYNLPEGVITRFYGDRLTFSDKARILTGRPPVSVLRALSCLAETKSATGPR
ncbi:lycopene beta-cyclase CrtY [Xanthobacter dioxanivorans]|uniref:Lycopene beta-cyclase CrtY n=1 Tax=Xanthobacter dioxanivorans TaxID=2528964 RepID=A0A974SHU1_9HYPH|nr:lycopene beta-cyclase CrtY [Xanthobacter dioxanivorans]QRG05707.1 lycopene beta-cyclase CrtY [Xanthobacter dioxanivorans]